MKNPGLTLTEVRHTELGYTSICLTLPDEVLVGVNLDNFDKRLLQECGGPDATISDKLLGLETVTRRWEQHADRQHQKRRALRHQDRPADPVGQPLRPGKTRRPR